MADDAKSGHEAELEPLILLGDEPIQDASENADGLSMLPFARMIAGAAIGTPGPFTIGAYGGWGHGKTSVLRQAKALIDDLKPEVVTVWFSAWKFEREDQPVIPLLASITLAVEEKSRTLAGTLGEQAVKGLKATGNALRSLAFGVHVDLGLLKINPKEIIERGEELKERQTEEDPLFAKTLHMSVFGRLAEMGGDLADSKRPKIVVFIDDLDRCEPDRALRLLECIKVLLDEKGFVFVLAVNRHILDEYLKKLHRESYGIDDFDRSSRQYLDKLIQLPLPLPPHRTRFDEYVGKILENDAISADPTISETFRELKDVLLIAGTDNPRTLVRFVNNLLVDYRLWDALKPEKVDAETLKFCAVSRAVSTALVDDQIFAWLVRDDDLCKRIATCNGSLPQAEHLLADLEASSDAPNRDHYEDGPFSPEHAAEPAREVETQRPARREAQRQVSIMRAILQHDHLLRLFAHEIGRKWLRGRQRRCEVYEFIVNVREQPERETRSQRQTIDDAIRRSLRLKSGAKLTDEHRAAVVELDFSSEAVNDAGLEYLAGLVQTAALTSAQWLDLSSTQVTDAGLQHLAALTSLQWLDLSSTRVTDAGLGYLDGLISLRTLRLKSTQVTDAGLGHLSVLTSLNSLNLRTTQVTDVGLGHLSVLTFLRELYLGATQVTDAGLQHLDDLTSLEVLGLRSTRVTDVGVAHLAGLTTLREMYLGSTGVTDAALKHLAAWTSPRGLGLGSTQVTDAGLEHLSAMTSLQRLHLGYTQVGDTGLAHLAGLVSLQVLYLRSTQVTDAGLRHLGRLTSLQVLDLSSTQVTDGGKAALKEKLPNCTIYR